jgi:hypothetical protein
MSKANAFPVLMRFFYEWLVEQRNASIHTVRSYRDTWRLFLRFVAQRAGKKVAMITMTDLAFFAQVLLSLKLPSIYPAIDEHLAQDESVVVQLVSTAEGTKGAHRSSIGGLMSSIPRRARCWNWTCRPANMCNVELNITHILCSRSLCRVWRREAQVSFGFP